MRDKNGFDLTKKQREKYLQGVKMLYGSPSKGEIGIVPPRVNLEDLELSHEKPKASGMDGIDEPLVQKAAPRVPRGTRKPKAIKEWREQMAIYQWTQTLMILRGFVMKFDNEGRRNVIQASIAKKMGLLPGTSDLFIARPFHGFPGLWLEVKQNRPYTPSERAKDTWKRQEEFQERMRSVGFAAKFCYGADQGIEIITNYLRGQLGQQD